MRKLLLLILLPVSVFAQKDTSFWFAAPVVNQLLVANSHDTPILLRLPSFSNPATIAICILANPAFTHITASIAANSTAS